MNQRIRSIVLERDDFECQDCGTKVGSAADNVATAEVHHIIPESEGGSDQLENLTTLCPNCHSKKRGKEIGSSGGRPQSNPGAEQILTEMNHCEPYIVSDLEDLFSDASRWTIQRRLETLVENGDIEKKKHTENRVSYWIPS